MVQLDLSSPVTNQKEKRLALMIIRKILIFTLVLLLALAVFSGCNQSTEKQLKVGPEVGKWHAEIKISDVNSSMSDEDRLLLSMIAGDIMFEIDAEFCEDGTFTYVMNTDQLQEAISNSVSTVLGFFMKYDITLFTDRLVEAALQDALKSSKKDYSGNYTKSESNLIIATDGDNLYFRAGSNTLVQIDDNGNDVLKFTKVS